MTSDPSWAVLPILPQGNADPNRIFQAVGMALSSWERLEDSCALLYTFLLGAEGHGAARAYGTIVAFKARQEMLVAALEEHPLKDGPELAGLKGLIREAGRLSGRRNEIAHGQVHRPTLNGEARGHYLAASFYNSNKRPSHFEAMASADWFNATMFGSYAYTGEQIDAYTEHFQRLAKAIHAYLIPLQDYRFSQRDLAINRAVQIALDKDPS